MLHFSLHCSLAAGLRRLRTGLSAVFFLGLSGGLSAVPLTLSYQGHLVVAGLPFEGSGQFKFALLDGTGASQWSNDGTSSAGSEPAAAVVLEVIRGGYAVRLGDMTVSNMSALTGDLFDQDALFLRVWFSADGSDFHQLVPDKEFSSVAFSLRSASAEFATTAGTVVTVPNIDASKISSGIISNARLDPAVTRDSELNAQVAALQAQIDTLSGQIADAAVPYVAASTSADDAALLDRGYTRFTTVTPIAWSNGSVDGEPSARTLHSAVWTGTSWIVWGGEIAPGLFTGSGAAYDPAENTWSALSGVDAPVARGGHSAVWTGSEMLIWGGISADGFLGDGARFDPETQLWTPMNLTNAPVGRTGHVSIWTGDRLIVWGGMNPDGLQADGAQYLPASDTWLPLSVSSPPSARMDARAVWAGDRMILIGGEGVSGPLGDGAQLRFSSGVPSSWEALESAGAPSRRIGHSLVWTGSAAIVFGGRDGDTLLGDGAIYNPATDAWAPVATTGAPSACAHHAAFWTGDELVVVGGTTASGSTGSARAFDPGTALWRSIAGSGTPLPRSSATVIWTGAEAFVFGGINNTTRLAALQRLDPSPTLYLYRAP